MKNMLNFKNFSKEELKEILDTALDMKKNPEKYSKSLEGKIILFLKRHQLELFFHLQLA